jgi:hypothetical protein
MTWTHSRGGHDRDPREDELAQLGIRVVGYTEVAGGGYGFKVGGVPCVARQRTSWRDGGP